jgi:hypothetical protein
MLCSLLEKKLNANASTDVAQQIYDVAFSLNEI